MKEKLYQFSDLEIWKEDDLFFAVYDAGSHQVAMRKDQISEDEALLACSGQAEAAEMLFSLQKRLIEAGVNPYVSNFHKPSNQ